MSAMEEEVVQVQPSRSCAFEIVRRPISAPKPLPKGTLLFGGDLIWLPGDDADRFYEKVYYVTPQYYGDGKVKVGNSKEKGRWVCIVKQGPRFCRCCWKFGDHLTMNCPNHGEISAGSLTQDSAMADFECVICMEYGHQQSICPYLEQVPKGARVGDGCILLCKCCAVPVENGHPDKDWIGGAYLPTCLVCGRSGHQGACPEDKCLLCKREGHKTKNCPEKLSWTPKPQTSLTKNCPTEKERTTLTENHPKEKHQASLIEENRPPERCQTSLTKKGKKVKRSKRGARK